MKKYSFIFIIILSTLLSSCSAINEFLAASEERDAKKISHYAPVVYQRPYEETGNTALVQTFENGKQNGPFEVHYLDGKLQIKGNYKDDKKGKLVTKGEYNQISKTFETVFGENLKKTLKTN